MKRNVKQCPICSRYISISNYKRHESVCDGVIHNRNVDRDNCKFCDKHIPNKGSLIAHERYCKLNPYKDIKPNNLKKHVGRIQSGEIKATNQFIKAKTEGLPTPEVSDETRKKLRDSYYKNLYPIITSKEYSNRISGIMRDVVRRNPKSYSTENVSGRVKTVVYNGIKLKGSWELEVAKSLDFHSIKWTNDIEGIPYTHKGKSHLYFPDFYLIDFGRYIEVKGFQTSKDISKWKVVDGLVILKKNEIKLIKTNKFIWNDVLV